MAKSHTGPLPALPPLNRNRKFYARLRDRAYENSFHQFRALEPRLRAGGFSLEDNPLVAVREFIGTLADCNMYAQGAMFGSKRRQSAGTSIPIQVQPEESAFCHLVHDLWASATYLASHIDTNQILWDYVDPNESFAPFCDVLSARYSIANRLFGEMQMKGY
jgi:hypothetical protein